jgi:hypothetical protein
MLYDVRLIVVDGAILLIQNRECRHILGEYCELVTNLELKIRLILGLPFY